MKVNQFMKKVIALVLVFAMIVPMFANLGTNTKEVQAAETATKEDVIGYVIVPKASVDTTGSQPTVASGYESNKYADYLFGGWFSDAEAMTVATTDAEKLYARFVPSDVLSTKCQVTTGLVTDTNVDQYRNRYVLRFVSSIDSLDYRHVGFEISYKDGDTIVTKTNKTNTVFERIESTTGTTAEGQDTYAFSPKVMSTKSEYFITAKWPVVDTANEKEKDYTVRAFWMTMDGTKVYGESRTVCVNDGLTATNSINLSVANTGNVSVVLGETLAVSEDANLTAKVIGIDNSSVQVRISGVNKATMKSATKFTLTKDNATVGSEIYRNLYTKYDGTTNTVDKSWYETNTSASEYIIATSADLYGLAAILNAGTYAFGDNTIYLVSDIKVNDEVLVTEPTDRNYKKWYSAETDTYQDKPTYADWIPAGRTGKMFNGTFDGQMHTISGLNCNSVSDWYTGLFGQAYTTAIIKNLKLTNSYFKSSGAHTGSIVGRSYAAELSCVYSDAIVETDNKSYGWCGGLVGYANQQDSDPNSIIMERCWFDGTVINSLTTKPDGGTGGLLGNMASGTATLTNCLNTGNVSHSTTSVSQTGGLVGRVDATLNLTNCLNAGSVTGAYAASLVGLINGGSLTATNTYASENKCVIGYMQNSGKFNVIWPGGQSDQTVSNAGVQNVNIMTYWSQPAQFLGENAKKSMPGVDFDMTWSIIPNENPVLTSFESVVMDTSWYDEDEDTYVLYDKADLWGFSALSQKTDFAGKTIKLGNDIVVNTGDESTWATTAPKYAWMPASSSALPFAGTFDGGMHTIRGLYMNTTTDYSGLFSVTSATSVIKNLKVEDSYFTSTGMALGSIAGTGKGKLENVYSGAVVIGSKPRVGGLIGNVEGSEADLKYCWYQGTVTNTGNERGTGGLVGIVYGTAVIDNCLNSGTVDTRNNTNYVPKTGGLVGSIESGAALSITDSFHSGTVHVMDGKLGGNIAGCIDSARLVCTTTYGFGVTNAVAYAQGQYTFVVNYMDNGIMRQASYTKNTNGEGAQEAPVIKQWDQRDKFKGEAAISTMAGFDFTNGTWQTVEASTPVLNLSPDLENMDKRWYDASVTEYVLYDKGDLYGFAELAKTTDFVGKTVKLGNDIVLHEGNAAKWGTNPFLNVTDKWTPIGSTSKPFAGTFDGGLYTISGLFMSATVENSGLFGVTTADSVIKNVKLENSYLTSTANNVGSIVGCLSGTVENVYSDAFVMSGKNGLGGLVGITQVTAHINKGWFAGTVTNVTQSADGKGTGGIVGLLYGTVNLENCLNSGTVDATASDQYVPKTGGLVGGVEASSNLSLTDCLNTGDVLLKSDKVGGYLVGCYSANMTFNTSYGYGNDKGVGYRNGSYLICVNYISNGTETTNASCWYELDEANDITENEIIGSAASSRLYGFDFATVWKTVDGGKPVLKIDEKYESIDTSWYDASATEYVLYDEGDLYGFAELAKTTDFEGKTVKLGRDIEVNDGNASEWDTKEPPRRWTPIGGKWGDAYNAFDGTFDGQGRSISGLYLNRNNRYTGLFAAVGEHGIVQNLRLENSYFESDSRDFGSITGRLDGKIYMVYSDAIIKAASSAVGGIVGIAYNSELENCWYDGDIKKTATDNDRLGVGGIVGMATASAGESKVSLYNCLNTADFDISVYTSTHPCVGGLIGRVYVNGEFCPQVSIDACLNTGIFTKNDSVVTGGVGPIVGYNSGAKDCVLINRTYATTGKLDNNITGEGWTEVDADDIKGDDAKANMPYLGGWNEDWRCVEGEFPEIIFSTEGFGTGVAATTDELNVLTNLYANRSLYQGELHAHAKTVGRGKNSLGQVEGDDGSVALSTWQNEMSTYGLDFAASLDHKQTDHISYEGENGKWLKNLFIYGTEAGAKLSGLEHPLKEQLLSSAVGEIHYNMLFPTQSDLVKALSASGFNLTDNNKKYAYKDFSKSEFIEHIKNVMSNKGFFVHAHPTQTTYSDYNQSLDDYYFTDYVGFEVFYINTPSWEKGEITTTDYTKYGAYGTNESLTHYTVWDGLLKQGKRLYATAGSDTHSNLNTYALTSVYSTADAATDKGTIIQQLREGDFTAGAVGIQMRIDDTKMGGHFNFQDTSRLVVNIDKFHFSDIVDSTHKYRIDVITDDGVVYRQPLNIDLNTSTPINGKISLDVNPNSKYYRVEVVDATTGYRIAIGQPIWNDK